MKRTKKEAAQTRTNILDAAMQVFASKGYAGTRLDDVAQAAGVTRGAITWHFSKKANLLKAALDTGMAEYGSRIEKILDSGLSPLDTIRSLVKEMLSSLEADEAYRKSMEILLNRAELTMELQQGWDEYVKEIHSFRRTLERVIQKGIMTGEIRPETDPELIAITIVSVIIGIEQLWLMDRSAFSAATVSDRIVAFLIQGIVST
jgi:TetR/AcrR family acrAB operon transcriptional repressor